MGLTMGNSLVGAASRQIGADNLKSDDLGQSMATGANKRADVVDLFLGNSLRDAEVVLKTLANSTNYSKNMLEITDKYLSTLAGSLQESLQTIGSAGPLSGEKRAILQQNLVDKKTQVGLLIKTADFDGKSLLSGDIKDLGVQVGLASSDKLFLNATDISGGKLWRTSATNLIIAQMKTANGTAYYATQAEADADAGKNINLLSAALQNNNAVTGATGSGAVAMTDTELATLIDAVRTGNTSFSSSLNEMAPITLAQIEIANGGDTFADSSIANLAIAIAAGGSRAELEALFGDDVTIDISDPALTVNLTVANNVFTTALNTIRIEQASIANQGSNIAEAADALLATINVTQRAADSYTMTDYVTTATEYSETIRTITSAISALQAANKIPEAAQELVRSLAR
ncbi:MAG: hypothetical protein COA94_07990 [Rickettsiales bacterium]|nr:MAG: hypothetical protein COA94_07990 [Rickettsiales bacterium]